MTVKTSYIPLVTKPVHLSDGSNSFRARWCPKLSRFKLTSLAVVVLLSTVFIIFRVLQPSLTQRQQQFHVKGFDHELFHNMTALDIINRDRGHSDRIRYKHTQRRLPQCLIIGVRKGGTRALLEFLNLHPRIQAERREMHFFDDEGNYSKGLDWYRKKMPWSFQGTITIEKTPAYFTTPEVPLRVKEMNASIKLIVIFRDPTERAVSDYTQIHAKKVLKNRPHETFRNLAINRETGEVRRSYNAIKRSIYHRYMERWLDHFPLKQFHFVNAERLVVNPVAELYELENFLGLDHKITKENFYYNATRGFYCVRNDTHEKCLAQSKGRKHPGISSEVIEKLQVFFSPHNEKLYNLIGIDFGWP